MKMISAIEYTHKVFQETNAKSKFKDGFLITPHFHYEECPVISVSPAEGIEGKKEYMLSFNVKREGLEVRDTEGRTSEEIEQARQMVRDFLDLDY